MRIASLTLPSVGLRAAATLAAIVSFAACMAGMDGSTSTGARILVERHGEMLRIRGAFVNGGDVATDTLSYELDVRRVGGAGTSQSTQSGRFRTVPGRTDTLSTVRINVQSGDRLTIRLTIRRDGERVDEARRDRAF